MDTTISILLRCILRDYRYTGSNSLVCTYELKTFEAEGRPIVKSLLHCIVCLILRMVGICWLMK